jgi:uncharacterized protein
MQLLTPLLSGLLFGLGLILSGMADPLKVKGFLDVAGIWNPSVALSNGMPEAALFVAAMLAGMAATDALTAD